MTLYDLAFSLTVIAVIAFAVVYGGRIFGGEGPKAKKP
jgi:hypothetical protein